MSKLLEVGDKFYLRNDLKDRNIYGADIFVQGMNHLVGRELEVHSFSETGKIQAEHDGWSITYEMIDWPKTVRCNPRLQLNVGDEFYIKGDMLADDVSDINIDSPHYYTNGIETQKYVRSHDLNFNRGSAIKYATRAGNKDKDAEIQDLKKAINFLQFEIDALEQGEVYFASKREIN